MTEELTTRDIFEQLNTRLTRVEDDLRTFRTEVMTRFDQTSARFDARLDQPQWRGVSFFVITWVAVNGSIFVQDVALASSRLFPLPANQPPRPAYPPRRQPLN